MGAYFADDSSLGTYSSDDSSPSASKRNDADVLAALMSRDESQPKGGAPCRTHLAKADLDVLRAPIDKALDIHQDPVNPIQLWMVSDKLKDLCKGTTRGGPLPLTVLAIRTDRGELHPPAKSKLGLLVLENPDLGVERRENEADVFTLLDPAVLLNPQFYEDPFFDLEILDAGLIGDEIDVAKELGHLMTPHYQFVLQTPVYNGNFKVLQTIVTMKRAGKEVHSLISKPRLDEASFASGLMFLMLASKATVLEFAVWLYPDPTWTVTPADLKGKWEYETRHTVLGSIRLRFIASEDGKTLQGVVLYKRYDRMPDETHIESGDALKTDQPIVYTTKDGLKYVHLPGMPDNTLHPIRQDRVVLTERICLDKLRSDWEAQNVRDVNTGWSVLSFHGSRH